jgi:F-type H+-transporting ATPase subunit epsilon
MADKTFQIEVITPDRSAVKGDWTSLVVTASDGKLGVLANHAPLIAMLATGDLRGKTSQGKEETLAVGEGFIEVQNNQVMVLTDFAEFPGEIDLDRAEKAKERAQERLTHRSDPDIDDVRAEAALRRALVRLKLGGRG